MKVNNWKMKCIICQLYKTEENYKNIRNKELENEFKHKDFRYCCNDCFEKLGGIRDWEKVQLQIKKHRDQYNQIKQKDKDFLNIQEKSMELDDPIIWD